MAARRRSLKASTARAGCQAAGGRAGLGPGGGTVADPRAPEPAADRVRKSEGRWRDPPRRPTAPQRILPPLIREPGANSRFLDALQTGKEFHRPPRRAIGHASRRSFTTDQRTGASGSRIERVSGAARYGWFAPLGLSWLTESAVPA